MVTDAIHDGHPWATDLVEGHRLWPAHGVRLSGGELALAVLDPSGTRYVALAGATGWSALASANPRELGALSGAYAPCEAIPDAPGLVRLLAAAKGSEEHAPPVARPFLDGRRAWDGDAARLLAAFESACGPATLSVMACGGETSWLRSVDRLAGAEAVEAALARLPLLVPVLRKLAGRLWSEEGRALASPLLDPASNLARVAGALLAIHAATPFLGARPDERGLRRLLASLEGVWLPERLSRSLLRSAWMAPPDWMPRDPDAAACMASVTELARCLSAKSRGAARVVDLLAPVRGDWIRARAAVEAAAPGALAEPDRFAEGTKDMARAFAEEVMHPAAVRIGAVRDADEALAGAWRILFSGKGLPACARASGEWHARGHAVTRAVRALTPDGPRRWPRTLRDHRASNGRRVTELASFGALCDEGADLAHCVATYAAGCTRGEYLILSVRDPSGRASSTVQVTPDLACVLQHRGLRNAPPYRGDVDALAECLASQATSAARVRRGLGDPLRRAARCVELAGAWLRRAMGRGWVGRHPYDPAAAGTVEAAIAQWARHMPRTARDPAALWAAVAAPDRDPAPPERAIAA